MVKESWRAHFDRPPYEGGVPRSEEIFIQRHAESVASAFTTRSSEEPVAFLFMGAPGSGKSRLRKFFDDYSRAENYVYVDPDIYKERLPEYHENGAAFVHEESSWLAAQTRGVAIARLCNLMNDAVGSDTEKYSILIKQL